MLYQVRTYIRLEHKSILVVLFPFQVNFTKVPFYVYSVDLAYILIRNNISLWFTDWLNRLSLKDVCISYTWIS